MATTEADISVDLDAADAAKAAKAAEAAKKATPEPVIEVVKADETPKSADAPILTHDFFTGHAPGIAYSTVGVLTGTTLWLGGFMREQVCIYMCPWPRIQSAMLDEK